MVFIYETVASKPPSLYDTKYMHTSITQQLHGCVVDILRHIAPDIQNPEVSFEHPIELSHGDYATNVAMRYAKQLGMAPSALAEQIVVELNKDLPEQIERVERAGPGFINFFLSQKFFQNSLAQIVEAGPNFGKNKSLAGKKIMVEFTDPNPFKPLHIGHMMSNTIGESLSRIISFSGAELKQVNYQGDIGMHVAKALWGMQELGWEKIPETASLREKIDFLGKAYAHGSTAYEDEKNKEAIHILNKKSYEHSDPVINNMYAWGRTVSLDYFETQYLRLGMTTKSDGRAYDFYFFETDTGPVGADIVREFLASDVFEESDGAVVFPGEKYNLHTRVFINSLGIPTYEAKELGLAQAKFEKFPYDQSFNITGNEINQYFKVLLKVMSFTMPELAERTTHIGHGMLRLSSGKMSSRTGNVIWAEDFLNDVEAQVREKVNGRGDLDDETISAIALSAMKFAILKQDITKDIIYDVEKSLSFEGDSGPYLQYTYARCRSLLEKGTASPRLHSASAPENWESTELEKLLYRFPEIIAEALHENSSHYIATYLIDVARAFNSWYGNTQILDANDKEATQYKLAIVESMSIVLRNGLWVLGIHAPEKM